MLIPYLAHPLPSKQSRVSLGFQAQSLWANVTGVQTVLSAEIQPKLFPLLLVPLPGNDTDARV